MGPGIEDKVFRTSFSVYFVSKIERVKTNVKLTLHETLIQSLIYFFRGNVRQTLAVEISALEHTSFRTIGSFPSRTPIGEFRISFKQLYICGYFTENASPHSI